MLFPATDTGLKSLEALGLIHINVIIANYYYMSYFVFSFHNL